jgi:Effector Associated Constant Component 1
VERSVGSRKAGGRWRSFYSTEKSLQRIDFVERIVSEQSMTLTVESTRPGETLVALVRDFKRDLQSIGIDAEPASEENTAGTRGDGVSIGQLLLAAVSGGAVPALIGCLKAYLARDASLVYRVEHSDGSKLEISAKNVDKKDVESALRKLFSEL